MLLDTQAFLWWSVGDRRMSRKAMKRIDAAPALRFSTASLWEIAIKRGGKGFDFELPPDWDEVLVTRAVEFGMEELQIHPRHCKRAEMLPFHHRDPFDRMIIAQSLVEGMEVVSIDERFDDYGVVRVW